MNRKYDLLDNDIQKKASNIRPKTFGTPYKIYILFHTHLIQGHNWQNLTRKFDNFRSFQIILTKGNIRVYSFVWQTQFYTLEISMTRQ